MSFHEAISATGFPAQDAAWLSKRVVVLMQFDAKHPRMGKVIRADLESPHQLFIQLDDGRIVRKEECSFKLAEEADG